MQDLEVALDDGAHVRPQHLDHDLLAAAQVCRVYLRDGRRGERRGIELLEYLFHRLPVGAPDELARDVSREGRHAVLQFRQLIGDVRRQQVTARRHGLAELDENRSQLFEREAQPLTAACLAAALEPHPRGKEEQEPQRPI